MKCPFCIDKNKETSVLDSRPSENGSVIRRRRICIDCKGRFTTHERIQFREIVVVKKDGDKVNFDRDKIAKSVELALRKRPVDTDTKEKLISRIVNDVEGMGENEISSNVIGESVMKALFSIDKVAYVRFASVYRDFRETKDFEQFLDTIDKK
jgi:transcriptional repressor NrdR|tara:strand:- start:132 stop:590 length:459 start_codon:yes stop_codon:yes gene_type:complete